MREKNKSENGYEKISNKTCRLSAARKIMEAEGIPDIVISNFIRLYSEVLDGKTGVIREKDILPVEHLIHYKDLDKFYDVGAENLNKLGIIKLNGGLGTSMGLNSSKSLLEAKPGLTFMDIIVGQIKKNLSLHAGKDQLPLILMNSFYTDDETKAFFKKYKDLNLMMFSQFKHPKINAENLEIRSSNNKEQDWNPPGHGDIYPALVVNGVLDHLITKGYRYIFISNSDNLGAVPDPKILGHIIENNIAFLMEVCERTESDSKGGHLAYKRKNSSLLLREVAQCPEEDIASFQDIKKHRFFNTNSVWLDLDSLKKVLEHHGNVLSLPLIRNKKSVRKAVSDENNLSEFVYQLETAMGAAIELFERSAALEVPRSRFSPVKKCSDLLVLWSDVFLLDKQYNLSANPDRNVGGIVVDIDDRFYMKYDDIKKRFCNVPSLLNCSFFKIKGDVFFKGDNVFEGDVFIENKSANPIELEGLHLRDAHFIVGLEGPEKEKINYGYHRGKTK